LAWLNGQEFEDGYPKAGLPAGDLLNYIPSISIRSHLLDALGCEV